MRFFIDTEFNGYLGDLISMALVSEKGSEWYECISCLNPVPWVNKHVIPVLNQQPLADKSTMANSLFLFLRAYNHVHIVADWPEDISYFCELIVTGPGTRINTPDLSFEIIRDLPDTADTSRIPHNALEDARALARSGG